MKNLIIAAALASAGFAGSVLAQNIAITGGKIYTQTDQGVIENGTVLIRDGNIESVNTGSAVPQGYRQYDARGKVVTPGLVGAMTSLGLVEVESWAGLVDASVGDASVSHSGAALDVSYAINPDSTVIDVSRIEGVTSAATTISYTDYLFQGQGSVISLNESAEIIRPRAFTVLDVSGDGAEQSGGSRAALWVTLERLFDEAAALSEVPGLNSVWEGLNTRADLEALQRILSGEMPLIMEADRKSDILQILAFKSRHPEIDIVLMDAAEAWRVADQLAEADIPVIMNPEMNLPDSFEAIGASIENAARLAQAGVRIAVGMETHNIRLATQHAGNAVANGLSHEQGIASLTSHPASILGVSDRVGSLAAGKQADVVIWSGDPLEVTEYAEQVFIQGQPIDMESRQTQLRNRYQNFYEQEKNTSQYIQP
ncbi:amidohydrolase family protein [Salinimonas chungwhensis]|uniref:amidohydrolase family protein n=1 Tax=Salinimonas chungwhensis TaxID=265425 RepID=UPI00035F19E2|nr:amidohydrolase family protein [Salinimonas chungwhensis]